MPMETCTEHSSIIMDFKDDKDDTIFKIEETEEGVKYAYPRESVNAYFGIEEYNYVDGKHRTKMIKMDDVLQAIKELQLRKIQYEKELDELKKKHDQPGLHFSRLFFNQLLALGTEINH